MLVYTTNTYYIFHVAVSTLSVTTAGTETLNGTIVDVSRIIPFGKRKLTMACH